MHVYIANEDPEMRHALRVLLEQRLGHQVVGEAAHAHGLTALVEAVAPDLVLISWDLPGRVDARLVQGIHRLMPAPRVVVTSCHPDLREHALAAGADAFADTGQPASQLLAVLAALPAC